MFLDEETVLETWLNPGLNLTIFRGTGPRSASQAKGFSLFWLCLVGYLHLNKQFDAWENF